MQCDAVCCGMLQCIAVCRRELFDIVMKERRVYAPELRLFSGLGIPVYTQRIRINLPL